MNPRRVAAVLAALAAVVLLIVNSLDDDQPPRESVPAAGTTAPAVVAGSQPADLGAQAGPVGSSQPAASPSDLAGQDGDPQDDSLTDPDTGTVTVPGNPGAVAAAFADAWIRHTGPDAASWASRLAEMSTPDLADLLRDVDPAVVPASRVTGPPIVASTDTWADAAVPTDAGVLQLQLFYNGRWIVTILDWTPAS